MIKRFLRIATIHLLGLGALCWGGDEVSGDAMEMGAFRVHAIQAYNGLHLPNTNSLIECRAPFVALHLPTVISSNAVGLEQRLPGANPGGYVRLPPGFSLSNSLPNCSVDCLPRTVSFCFPPPTNACPVSVTQRLSISSVNIPINMPTIQLASIAMPPLAQGMAGGGNGGLKVALNGPSGSTLLPIALSNSVVLCRDPQRVDRLIVDNILDAEKAGGDGKWDPVARRELLNYIITYPVTQDGYEIFAVLVTRTPGNTEKRRLANLGAMATDAFGELANPVMTYYTACHLYRSLDYEGALTYIDCYESQYSSNPERIRILRALCLTQMNRAGEAIIVLKKLQADLPDSPLMPDIKFMEGWIWFQDGKNDQARSIMEVIIRNYRGTSAASQAKQVLDELNGAQ